MSSADIAAIQLYLITNSEDQQQLSSSIVILLILILCSLEILSKSIIELVEAFDKSFSSRIDCFYRGYQLEVIAEVIAVVCKEESVLSRGTLRIIINKLGEREEIVLVILLIIAIDTKILFQRLVRLLYLTIRLRVISYRLIPLNIAQLQQTTHESRGKLLASIGYNILQ